MADRARGDRLTESTDGLSGTRTRRAAEIGGPLEDPPTAAARDAELGDADQEASEADQTLADGDQTSADRDQLAADRDQEASDRDLASGVDADAHASSRAIRERAAEQREQTAQARLEAAHNRDRAGHLRDLAAEARDQAAEARDLAMTEYDVVLDDAEREVGRFGPAELAIRAAGRRRRAARMRAAAAGHRALAARDRESAAEDRRQATRERRQALIDREALARQLALAATDAVTETLARPVGLSGLEVELERCRRTSTRLTLARVEVVGPESVDDELLKGVATLIKQRVRPYDLVVRLPGDEFLCAMPDVTIAGARERFAQIAATLEARRADGSLAAGFAEFTADQATAELIASAKLERTDDP